MNTPSSQENPDAFRLESRVLIMGVLNATPDSFSDGGRYFDIECAVDRALEIEAEGADILDIGGESTRPGSAFVDADEERRRVIPLLERLSGRLRIPVSIDTTKYDVARDALTAGAEIINDISGLRFEPRLADLAAGAGAALVLMHSRGTPETMQQLPPAEDIFGEVIGGLRWSIDQAVQRGVACERIILDPGIGFGKTAQQNLMLIAGLDRIVREFGLPVLVGASRKSFIGRTLDSRLTATRRDAARERLAGTIAANIISFGRGARILRVHDVAETAAAVRLAEAIEEER
ncbi:MAG: dihydropteroate synthase [Acidobacteria bacterium]|nr:dihydropteroate synthase [Acidobacteriota bacterium]MCW5971595.1 dihydropteroate synthase [Blastocatellales bacterium]